MIVAEQFDLRPSNKFTADLTPVKVNAVLDWLVDDVHYQTPAQAKGLVKDATLKNLGWWLTGKDVGYKDANDVRDAFRHLVYYLVHEMRHKWTLEGGWLGKRNPLTRKGELVRGFLVPNPPGSIHTE